ncbi:hypothetical protein HED60_14720 [Planctomycetales bacterium ZRK34]|nr:hypothetical protein HED60_14720 [Planctomycetales bacterium ZRK34]
MTHEQHNLMLRYLDGECSPDEHAALTDALRDDEQLKREFVGLCLQRRIMREALHRKGSLEAFIGEEDSTPLPITPTLRRSRSVWYSAAALAAAMVIIATAWFTLPDFNRTVEVDVPPSSAGLAMITDQRGARWGGKHATARNGDSLPAGILELESGSAQLMLTGGAVVDLRGPTRFQLIDDNHTRLFHGELSAWVPQQAHGFTVDAPGAQVVDLGTEFSMNVNPLGDLRLQVTAGRVRLITADTSRLVAAGDAWIVDAAGSLQEVDFVMPTIDPWETATAVYYKLQGDGGDASGHHIDLHAAVSPFDSDDAAPTFAHDGGRQLRRQLTAEQLDRFDTDQFTITAWVRDPSLTDDLQDHNGIFAYRNGNESRFQLTVLGAKGHHTGALRLDYHRADTGKFHADAGTDPLTWAPGVWYHLAVVFDAGSPASGDGVVRFYRTPLGGATELVATCRDQPEMTPLTIGGALTLGGFEGSDMRCFGGSIASVRYINHPLDDRQIADLAASPPSTIKPNDSNPKGDL